MRNHSSREPGLLAETHDRCGICTGRAWSSRFRGLSKAAMLLVASAIAVPSGCGALRFEESPASAPIAAPAASTRFAPILFGSGSVDLSIQARKQIHGIATALLHSTNGGGVVVVEGYSDSRGSAEGNLKISRERAEAVARELAFNGLSRDRIRVEAYGEERPIKPNIDDQGNPDSRGRAANRRVEVYIAK